MKISELKPKLTNVEVEGTVTEKGEVREFSKFGRNGRVCSATLKDDSGSVTLTLWNEQVDQVNVDDQVQITDGIVNEWQGNLQVSTGRSGKLEVKA